MLCYYCLRLAAIFGGLLNGCSSNRTGNQGLTY
jgi:hypothetical protein